MADKAIFATFTTFAKIQLQQKEKGSELRGWTSSATSAASAKSNKKSE
jgi:hypothetical protein